MFLTGIWTTLEKRRNSSNYSQLGPQDPKGAFAVRSSNRKENEELNGFPASAWPEAQVESQVSNAHSPPAYILFLVGILG